MRLCVGFVSASHRQGVKVVELGTQDTAVAALLITHTEHLWHRVQTWPRRGPEMAMWVTEFVTSCDLTEKP